MQKSVKKTCQRNIVAPTEGVQRHLHVVTSTDAVTPEELVIRTSGDHFKFKKRCFVSSCITERTRPQKVIALADCSKY